ncbi:hypothetical protein, partial [Cysteiniphilum litorale]
KFKDYLDDHYTPQNRDRWLGDISQQNDPLFKKAQESFVVANSDVYLDWYKHNSASIDSRGQTDIKQLSSDVDQGRDVVKQARTDNDQAVTRAHGGMQDELEYQIHERKGEKIQSTVPMMEQVHRDNFALMKQLGIMPQDHEFKGKFADYNKPESPLDLKHPDMSKFDKVKDDIQESKANLSESAKEFSKNVRKKATGDYRDDDLKPLTYEEKMQQLKEDDKDIFLDKFVRR